MIGFLNVYKPQGISSAAVVGKIKKQFNLKKVGHMGTLDPLACGILPIAIGKATRMFDYFLNKQKQYVVIAEFGYETASLDLGTDAINKTNFIPTFNEVKNACTTFLGKIEQIPPIYSAKNINGEKAYNLAREGKVVELNACSVEIFNFECLEQLSEKSFKFVINCSSGTYVRSLIRDLAYKLNSLATVTFLERSETGLFNKQNSIELNKLLTLNSLSDCLINIEELFKTFTCVNVSDIDFYKLKNGLCVELSNNKIDNNVVFVKKDRELLGVANVINGKLKLKTYLLED
ncbi:MAG: tRNA pseudouridine(55) synthase TruB [Clostridia bacterium]|nr:tRNA pseudouridine(55) synthase TruB [Clostridia bacterium]